MKKRMNLKFHKNETGAVLLTAVAVLAMMSILLTATLSFVATNQKQTMSNYKKEQAYLTASTTLESFIAKIQNDTAPTNDPAGKIAQQQAMNDLKALAEANGGLGTTTTVSINGTTDNTENMGTCTITVAQEGTSSANIAITCEATYLGETESVTAHIATDTKLVKTDYTNAIEITGSSSTGYDNLNVVGDMSVINDSTGKVYSFTNNSTIYGNYFMYGSLKNNTQTTIYLMPSLTESGKGTSVTVSENLIAESNDFKFMATMARGDGYNYINVGQRVQNSNKMFIGAEDLEIDLYCSKIEIGGNEYKQYGNLYCYKMNSMYNGDMTITGNDVEINGDVFVEGNLSVSTKLTVNGDLYVGGTITGEDKLVVSGDVKKNAIDDFSKVGRAAKPQIPIAMDDYMYYPEDFFMSTDSTITSISDKYKAFYNGTNTETLMDFEVETTVDDSAAGVTSKYNFCVTKSCTWSDDIDFNKYGNGQMKVLVKITDTSEDIVIRMKSGLDLGSNWRPTFIVKNESSIDPDTNCHKYNCYFVSDSGTNITLGTDTATGKSTHTYKDSDGKTVTPETTYRFENLVILDYETYIRSYTDVDSPGSRGNQNDSFILNPTLDEITGTYKPDPSSIYVLLGEGCTFKNANNCLFQCTFYAPQATIDIATSGKTIKVALGDGVSQTLTADVSNIGVVIASSFGSANTSYYVFQQPSATSVLSNAKGEKDDTAYGYELKRYDHY